MNDKRRNGLTYAQAGVDIDAGNRMVDLIKPLVRATARPGADAEIGGFGGLFDLKRAGFRDPVLVAGTDGVGTKLVIAIEVGKHDTIGIDLVAMSVNDIVVQGGEPLFFLDYFATGKLSPEIGAEVVTGIAKACRAASRPAMLCWAWPHRDRTRTPIRSPARWWSCPAWPGARPARSPPA